jgi:sugar lactone lactonase YvrE
MVTTLAGTTNSGSLDGIGSSARFNGPQGIAVDLSSNVYVADTENHSIRRITPQGIITTLAGLPGVSGISNGVGTAARFNYPYAIALDNNTNLVVADTASCTIRKVTIATGNVTTLAGRAGAVGKTDGSGANARFHFPLGISTDTHGNIYVADTYNNLIRRIDSSGAVTTIAGTTNSGYTNGIGSAAAFSYPISVAVQTDGTLYVTDYSNNVIRAISPSAVVTTLAGKLESGVSDGTGTNAAFSHPRGITLGTNGALYVTDSDNHLIREVTTTGVVTTCAGAVGGPGTLDDIGSGARFSYPAGVVVDPASNTYVADLANHTIRKISPAGAVSTFVGLAGTYGTNDGNGSSARFHYPCGIAIDSQTNLFVTDNGNACIRKITPSGQVSTFAGTPGVSGNTNGTGAGARFNNPIGLAIDNQDNLYVGDAWNHQIRKITPAGVVSTLAGSGSAGRTNGTRTSASFSFPEGVAVDGSGSVYVADAGNSLIRKITAEGVVTTLAGATNTGNSDGISNAASFYNPFGVAVDANTNLYVTDANNNLIRKVTPNGQVTTLAGSTMAAAANGNGAEADFNLPEGLTLDQSGNILVADCYNHAIRKLSPSLGDTAVVDVIRTNLAGITRHFAISNQTTTSWSWSFLRYPTASAALLFATNTANPTLTPDVSDLYIVRFQGWDSQGHAAIGTISVAIDAAPAILITNPVPYQQISKQTYTVGGTAGDDGGIVSVWFQVNDGAWTLASGTNSWSASVTWAGGDNTLRAYAVDTAGNVSATNSVSITFSTEKVAPTLAITSPKASQRVSNEVCAITGTAKDAGGLASVWYRLNSGTWTKATGTTNWTGSVTLVPGTNLLEAYSKDISANPSRTNSIKFVYVLSDKLTLLTTGRGTLSPNYSNSFLQISNGYSITAAPAAGYLFSNWTSGSGLVLTNGAKITFTMVSNLTLVANFITNPFIPAKGTFTGLFQPQATSQFHHTNSGLFTATLTDKGAFSAKLTVGGATYSASGSFPIDGNYSGSVVRKGLSPLALRLKLDLQGSNVVTGTVASDAWTANLQADRSVYSKATPAPLANQKFTLVIAGTNRNDTAPGNYSSGAASIAAAGTISFSGILSDGTKVTQSAPITQNAQWPFYISLYSAKGSIRGWLNFTNESDHSPAGALGWTKSLATAKVYPAFNLNEGLEVYSSAYTNSGRVLNITNSVLTLSGGDLTNTLYTGFTLTNNNKIIVTNKLSLTFTAASGLFTGKVPATVSGKAATITINGAVLQNQNQAYGSFMGTTNTGQVMLQNKF